MAITWTGKTSNEDPAKFRADVTFTRVDDAVVDGDFSVSYPKAVIKTGMNRQKLFDAARSVWVQEKARRTEVKDFVTDFEQKAKIDLEAREV